MALLLPSTATRASWNSKCHCHQQKNKDPGLHRGNRGSQTLVQGLLPKGVDNYVFSIPKKSLGINGLKISRHQWVKGETKGGIAEEKKFHRFSLDFWSCLIKTCCFLNSRPRVLPLRTKQISDITNKDGTRGKSVEYNTSRAYLFLSFIGES